MAYTCYIIGIGLLSRVKTNNATNFKKTFRHAGRLFETVRLRQTTSSSYCYQSFKSIRLCHFATSYLGKFQMAISSQGVTWSTSCLVLRWGFWGRRIEWRCFRFDQIQDGGSVAILDNSKVISPGRIVWFTLHLVLGWDFRGRRIEWRYFQFDQFNRCVGEMREE